MHFQIIKDDYFNFLPKDLKDKVPDFKSVFDEEDGVYPILGEFCRFVVKNIDNNNISSKVFDFINHAIDVGGNETQDAIILQLFQPIYDDITLVKKYKNLLSTKASQLFELFMRKYLEDFHHKNQ